MTDVLRHDTLALARLLAEKHECLLHLQALGREQIALVDEGDLSELLGVIGQKQRWLEQLQQTERALDPFRGQTPASRRWRSEDDRQRCAELIASSESLYAEIIAREKESEQRLVRRRDEAAERLSGAHFAAASRSAYAADHVRRSQFDLTSES